MLVSSFSFRRLPASRAEQSPRYNGVHKEMLVEKTICTVETLQRHMNTKFSEGPGNPGLRIGRYVLRLEENDKRIATVAFYLSVDLKGNISIHHEFTSEGNRIKARAE